MKNMKNVLIITGDTNDADYVTKKSNITTEQVELFKPIIESIKNFKPYKVFTKGMDWTHENNFPYGDGEFIPRKDLDQKSAEEMYGHLEGFKDFLKCVPFGEYGIHTIESIELLIIDEEIKLL